MSENAAAKRAFLTHYTGRIASGDAALFAGAGLSAGSGFVDWQELLREVASEIGLVVDRETDLVALAQYHQNRHNSRATLNRRIIEAFARHGELNANHRLLARLPIRTVWTTNYDTLIEDAYREAGKTCQAITTAQAIPYSWARRDVVLYKMHGDIQDPSSAVITKDDYETYRTKREQFLTVLTSDLLTKTFLFLGFSFTDPNLDYLLAWIRMHRGENPAEHYWITRRVQPSGDSAAGIAEYEYACRKQELRVEDMKRYGIKAVLVDTYDEITELLAQLSGHFRQHTVFVSGSAHDPAPLGVERLEALARGVGEALVSRDYRIVTGFGLGIGGPTLLGAISALHMKVDARLEDRVLVRPFPTGLAGRAKRDAYAQLRHELMEQCGFALYVSGNRPADGTVEPAAGVLEEFEIATEAGVLPIPVGTSGHVAQQIWERVSANVEKYFGALAPRVAPALAKLGDREASNDELIEAVISILHEGQQASSYP